MKKWQIAGLVIVIVLLAGIVIAEQMTFSTYYPAPYGRYREFSTTGRTTLATNEFGIETDEYARVGIGTTEPAFPLTVIGRIGSSSLSTNGRILLHWDDTGGGVGNINSFDTDHYTRMKIEGNPVTFNVSSNGNVGIGTANPGPARLHVFGAQNGIEIENPAVNSTVQLALTNDARQYILSVSGEQDDNLVFYDATASQTRMVIDTSGNVGIGTVSPNSSKGSGGYLDAKDVYLRDTGTWASEGGGGFGAWSTLASSFTTWQDSGGVDTDGFLICYWTGTVGVKAETPIGTIRQRWDKDYNNYGGSFILPVREGDSVKVYRYEGGATITKLYWLPL